MKTTKKRLSLFLALMLTVIMTLTGCTAVQVSGQLQLNKDGSGERTIEGRIAKNDYQDGYGSAYYYLKQHGDDLAAYIKDVYTEKVPGSEEWLTVAVDDSADDWEVVKLTFAFTSFEDYTEKLTSLAYDETAATSFAAPSFGQDDAGNITYSESTGVMTAIFKSLQTTLMADDAMFDINCTKDGTALNDGSADLQSLTDSGVELMKPENGMVMTISVDGGEETAMAEANGTYTFGAVGDKEPAETTCVLYYTFDDTLANSGTEADNDLVFGTGSTGDGPVYEDGLDGKAIKFDGATYLASPNKDFNYEEMTISFDYRMDAYTQTDSGANMVIVPAGLGALGAGVIDVEFIKEADAEGVQLLGKMNSADWQTQDKLFSEGYLLEAHMGEWHNYTLVYQNEYDDSGEINDSYVYMYIDGKLATRSRLAVAAGLTYSLGLYDNTAENANGGFNVGGYYEAETVKRGCTGALDNLRVFNGALSEEEVNTLCYVNKVDKEYDPAVVDTLDTAGETTESTEQTSAAVTDEANTTESGSNAAVVVIVVVIIVVAAAVIVVLVSKKKKTKK